MAKIPFIERVITMDRKLILWVIAYSIAFLPLITWANSPKCSYVSNNEPLPAGKQYFASPTGKGSNCSDQKPCSFATALNKVCSGKNNEVVLKNGTYRGKYKTKCSGITIRARNRGKAIIDGSRASGPTIAVTHSNVTVRGLHIDGGGKGRTLFISPKNTPPIHNIVIEENKITNALAAGIHVANLGNAGAIKNVVIRYNHIHEVGTFYNPGESIYLGSSPEKTGRNRIENVEIYGNWLVKFAHNGIDLKDNVHNAAIHYNILYDQTFKKHHKKRNNEGTMAINGTGHRVSNNLLKNNDPGNLGAFYVSSSSNNKIWNNAIINLKGPVATSRKGGNPKGQATEITNNAFCYTSQKVDKYNEPGILFKDNVGILGKQPILLLCKVREKEILNAMNLLPSGPGKWVCEK